MDEPTIERRSEGWHMEKGIPIAVLLFMVLQFAGFIWYASAKSNQIDQNAKSIQALQVQVAKQQDVTMRVTRIEALMQSVLQTLQDIKADIRDVRDRESRNGHGK